MNARLKNIYNYNSDHIRNSQLFNVSPNHRCTTNIIQKKGRTQTCYNMNFAEQFR